MGSCDGVFLFNSQRKSADSSVVVAKITFKDFALLMADETFPSDTSLKVAKGLSVS